MRSPLRPSSSLAALLGAAALTLTAACASSADDDELAGEADDEAALDGKADGSPEGAYTYFAIESDLRRCASPMCGGFHLDRLNASRTTCHDGTRKATCYAPVLDWSEAGLTEAQQETLRSAAARGAVAPGVTAIVRGRFARTNETIRPDLGRFVVTEAWVAQGEGVTEGVFAKVFLNGVRCIAAPCPSLTERALNSSRQANIAEIDYEVGEFSDGAMSTLGNDLAAPGGIIVAGHRFSFTVSGRAGRGRTATNAFANLANEPAATGGCFVGGCSGQICSDEEGAISTCEWREEYACYRDATCERQADGECGWTMDGTLQACLGL